MAGRRSRSATCSSGVGLIAAAGRLRRAGGARARARQASRRPTSRGAAAAPPGASTRVIVLARALRPAGRGRAARCVFAFYLAQGLVPRLSTHLSFKPVLESYAKFAHDGEKIGKYRVEGHGSTLLQQADDGRPAHAGSASCSSCAIRSACSRWCRPTSWRRSTPRSSRRTSPYYVVDASSSRFLLLTNQLDAGRARRQPAAQERLDAAAARRSADARSRPGRWRVPLSATFGDAIELVGADFPPSVRRPGQDPARPLSSASRRRPPGSYKIFVHFDGPAAPRVIGDHDPVNHTFGTSLLAARRVHPRSLRHRRAAHDHARRHLHGLHGLLAGRRGQAPQGDRRAPTTAPIAFASARSRSSRLDAQHDATRQRQTAARGDGLRPIGGAPAPTAASTRA